MIQIDKKKIYESHGYKFKNFVSLTLEEKLMILEWRNNNKVRKMMVNKDIISETEHLRFIENLKEREDCFYWLVVDREGNDIGVLDIIHVDEKNDAGELGFYLNPLEVGKGFEFVLECDYFIFNTIKLGNNLITIDVDNKDVLMLNAYFGTTFEGIKEIEGKKYYYNNHTNGKNLVRRYHEFRLRDYIAFMKAHKNIVEELKQKYHV